MISPAGKRAIMKVNTIGMNWNIFACTGSGGGGFSFCCRNMVTPMISGQAPMCRYGLNTLGSNGISPNRLNTLVGSPCDRSLIQRKNGACRISMVTKITLYSEKNTGIWTTSGRQPDAGLTFSALYKAIISGCSFDG